MRKEENKFEKSSLSTDADKYEAIPRTNLFDILLYTFFSAFDSFFSLLVTVAWVGTLSDPSDSTAPKQVENQPSMLSPNANKKKQRTKA